MCQNSDWIFWASPGRCNLESRPPTPHVESSKSHCPISPSQAPPTISRVWNLHANARVETSAHWLWRLQVLANLRPSPRPRPLAFCLPAPPSLHPTHPSAIEGARFLSQSEPIMADYLKNVFGGGSQADNKPAANPDTGNVLCPPPWPQPSTESDYG